MKTPFSIILLCTAVLSGCIQTPDSLSPGENPPPSTNSAIILCEGLFGQNNSTVARWNFNLQTLDNNYYSNANNGLLLGDTANDVAQKGDTIYVAVTASQTIEIFLASSGKWLGRIRLGERKQPRSIVVANDSIAYCTNLNDDSVTEFNPTTFEVRKDFIAVGPAPEGICKLSNNIFVANSGYGIYRYKEPKAGTISVVSSSGQTEISVISRLPNIANLAASQKRKTIYALYRHLTIYPDSIGGIAEIDGHSLQELRRWKIETPGKMSLNYAEDTLFFFGKNGMYCLPLNIGSAQPNLLFETPKNESWYGLNVRPENSELWIANARTYTTDGEIIVRTANGNIVRRFNVGLNPSKILFLSK